MAPDGTDPTKEKVFDVKFQKPKKRAEGEPGPMNEQAGTSVPTEDIPSLDGRLKEKARKKLSRVRATVAKPIEDENMIDVPEALKKSKKRKHLVGENKNQAEGEDESRRASDRSPEEPPKKKHKNRTEFSDPRVDATLNNQSRKALEYVFTLMNRPSKWKFNKARQNWVIRNVWSPDVISDTYFPLVVKYLNTVKGGSREKLKATCQSYLKIQDPSDATNESTSKPPEPKINFGTPTNTNPTPGPLIVSNPAPISTDADTTTPSVTPSSMSPATLVEIRRTRAHTLLHTLTLEKL